MDAGLLARTLTAVASQAALGTVTHQQPKYSLHNPLSIVSYSVNNKKTKMQTQTAQNIDLGLSVICAVASPGQTLTSREIAEFCDCSVGNIKYIQAKALKKLRENKTLQAYFEDTKITEIKPYEHTKRY